MYTIQQHLCFDVIHKNTMNGINTQQNMNYISTQNTMNANKHTIAVIKCI